MSAFEQTRDQSPAHVTGAAGNEHKLTLYAHEIPQAIAAPL
jgi:hypothetical protein